MANQDLATASLVTSALKSNAVFIEVDGSVRRITIDKLMDTINSGDEMLLRQVAWGIPIKQNQSSQSWGVIGNLGMRDEYESKCGRYLVTPSGLAAKLSPTDSSVYADGTALVESKGNVMFIAPRLYYVVKEDAASGVPYLWLSQLPIGGHYIGNCNNDEYVCIGAYVGSMSGSSLVSRSEATPAGNKTIEEFWTAAQTIGKDWGLTDYDHRRFMMMYALGHYGNPNIQACLGNGVGGGAGGWQSVSAVAVKLKTGATKGLGDSWAKIDIDPLVSSDGYQTTKSSRVNVGGIEDPYCWIQELLQGVYCGSSKNADQDGTEIFIYKGNRIPTAAELSTHPSGNYRQLTRLNVNGFAKTRMIGEYFDLNATAVGGGALSYWGSYVNQSESLIEQTCSAGGRACDALWAGLDMFNSIAAYDFKYGDYGCRLAYYGSLSFVSGAQLAAV